MARHSKENSNSKTLIVIRHAHRDKPQGGKLDNGLSEKGRRQVKRLVSYYRKKHKGETPYIVSSPKLRCVETVMPIAKLEKAEIQLSPLLLERKESPKAESKAHFAARIEEFDHWWRTKAPSLTVVCSHGDWIPSALEAITGVRAELAKGGLAEVEFEGDKPKLKWLLQDFSSV